MYWRTGMLMPLFVVLYLLISFFFAQFAYLQLGTLVSTVIRQMELRIDRVPEHNYHVSGIHYSQSLIF